MARVFEIADSIVTPVKGFDLDWLPAWAYDYVTPRASRDGKRVELEAGPFVGALPLAGDRVLYLVPRAGRRAFARMLLTTEGLDQAIQDELDAEVPFGAEEEEGSWVRLLARPFLRRLVGIEKESLAFARAERRETLPHARGRVDILPTLRDVARGAVRPVHVRYRMRTYETPENRMIAAAAERLLALGETGAELTPVADRWAKWVKTKPLRLSEFQHVQAGLSTKRYTGSRSYYAPVLVMARLILSEAGLSFDAKERVEMETVLVNMRLLFERYVRRLMAMTLTPQGLVVEKVEGGARARTLFQDGTASLYPDVLVSGAQGVRLVADAKYKPNHDTPNADYFQMAAYLDAYSCTTGMLIKPSARNTASLELRRMRDNRRVYELSLPLDLPDQAEGSLIDAVLRAVE